MTERKRRRKRIGLILALAVLLGIGGVFAVKTESSGQFFVLGHPEYDRDTLALEYFRDVKAGKKISVPKNYFPHDNPAQTPIVKWRSAAQLMYTNWLNYYVYQTTPYDLGGIK